jgi:NADPH:quinone reductase-like Zn-dependent oxidoreductase
MGYFAFGPGGQKLFDAYPYGGLSEYHTAPERNLVVLPDSVTFEQGARFGYLGTAFSALRKAGAGPGRTVLVDGISGTLGLGACLIALGLGATRILGTGRNPRPARRRQSHRTRPHRCTASRHNAPPRLGAGAH